MCTVLCCNLNVLYVRMFRTFLFVPKSPWAELAESPEL